jgi:hypothetical protein
MLAALPPTPILRVCASYRSNTRKHCGRNQSKRFHYFTSCRFARAQPRMASQAGGGGMAPQKSGSHETLRWRKPDSNSRFRGAEISPSHWNVIDFLLWIQPPGLTRESAADFFGEYVYLGGRGNEIGEPSVPISDQDVVEAYKPPNARG